MKVRRFFGFVLGGNTFLQCNDAKILFGVSCCFASSSRPCDVIDATNEAHGVIKNSSFHFHPAPRFVKGC